MTDDNLEKKQLSEIIHDKLTHKKYMLKFAEELSCPLVSSSDGSRVTMFSSHFAQFLTGRNMELPLVFAGYETIIGEESEKFAFEKAHEDMEVLYRFRKFVVVYRTETKDFHIIMLNNNKFITENFGFSIWNNDKFYPDKIDESSSTDNHINKGELLYRSSNYDDDANMLFGYNLKTLPMLFGSLTFEDGIVISKTASKKCNYENVQEVVVSVNQNDILLNTHGDENNFIPFPKEGESIKNGVLAVRRRLNTKDLNSFTDTSLNKVLPSDKKFYIDGFVTDIKVYANSPIPNTPVFKDIKEIYDKQVEEHTTLLDYADFLSNEYPDIPLSTEFLNYLERAKMYVNSENIVADSEKYKWTLSQTEFDFVNVVFTVMNYSPVEIGSKITNRFLPKPPTKAI